MKKTFIFLVLPLLSGCVTLVSLPLDETLNLLVTGYSELSSSVADLPACKLRYPLRSVCIEYNPNVAITDLTASLQRRLGQLKLESTLYSAGAQPPSCDALIKYSASRDWASHFASNDKQPYLNEAHISLYREGRMLATSHYQTSRLGYDKWTTTSTKLDPLVDELICQKTKTS